MFLRSLIITYCIGHGIIYKAFAQDVLPLEPTVCYAGEGDSFTQILPEIDDSKFKSIATSNIEVTYVNFPSYLINPFEKAVSIWEKYLVSSQVIRITANWSSLGVGVLAETGASKIYKDLGGLPQMNTWYPVTLAEALSNRNLNGAEADINVTLNSNINWYEGLDGKPQSGEYDLISILLHEIAHGLGFSSSMNIINNSQGKYGQVGIPYIFDAFMVDSRKNKLINGAIYGNPSTNLKQVLTSNEVFFHLSLPKFVNNPPQLYAPNPFRAGSSFSHLDEGIYPAGNPNSLMSPNIKTAEVIQKPGEVLLNCLKSMGWSINIVVDNSVAEKVVITANEENYLSITAYPNPTVDYVQVNFPFIPQENAKIYLADLQGKVVLEIENMPLQENRMNLEMLDPGYYILVYIDDRRKIVKRIHKR